MKKEQNKKTEFTLFMQPLGGLNTWGTWTDQGCMGIFRSKLNRMN